MNFDNPFKFNQIQSDIWEELELEKPPTTSEQKYSAEEIKTMSWNRWGASTGMNLVGIALWLALIGLIITALFRKNKSGLVSGIIGLVVALTIFTIIKSELSL